MSTSSVLTRSGQWVYIQRISVPAIVPTNVTITTAGGTIIGTDNGAERYWDYRFTAIPGTPVYTQYRALGVNAAGVGLFATRQP